MARALSRVRVLSCPYNCLSACHLDCAVHICHPSTATITTSTTQQGNSLTLSLNNNNNQICFKRFNWALQWHRRVGFVRCSGSLLDYESAFEPVGLSLQHPPIHPVVSQWFGSSTARSSVLFACSFGRARWWRKEARIQWPYYGC